MSKNAKLWSDVVARYYGDKDFASRLDSNPGEVLKELGVPVPNGKKVTLHKNTDSDFHLVLPNNPTQGLSEEFLGGVAAGFCGTDSSSCYE